MKRSKRFSTLVGLAGIALAGCATTTATVPADSPPARSAHVPSSNVGNPVVSWGNTGRAGAAELQPGYVHMIGRRGQVKVANAETVRPVSLTSVDVAPSAMPLGPGVEPLGPSMAEAIAASREAETRPVETKVAKLSAEDPLRRAWRHYCDGGKDLTDEEWRLLRDAGAPENVPRDLARDCVPPK